MDSPTAPLHWLFLLFNKRIWFQSIPNHHEARDKIQFTPISHIDIRPVECYVENNCKDDMFSLESVKVEEENFEIENSTFEENWNHEIGKIYTFCNNNKISYKLPNVKWLL
ncbi:unnamed protein product [Parnassius mnemosyne]|uniref:Uncharacterized protein n=1 Tax=Parnassius mnemosyne TaxID=213953 RepID=A0AAV1L9U0_9NEOP